VSHCDTLTAQHKTTSEAADGMWRFSRPFLIHSRSQPGSKPSALGKIKLDFLLLPKILALMYLLAALIRTSPLKKFQLLH
jgi:hypothetical protein